MDARICRAISARSIVAVSYGGGTRTILPHTHGISRAGNEVLRAWQTGGFSRSGEPVGWKLFTVDEFAAWSPTGGTFPHAMPEYNAADRHMERVHCHF